MLLVVGHLRYTTLIPFFLKADSGERMNERNSGEHKKKLNGIVGVGCVCVFMCVLGEKKKKKPTTAIATSTEKYVITNIV